MAENYIGGMIKRNPQRSLAHLTLDGIRLEGLVLVDMTSSFEIALVSRWMKGVEISGG